MASIKYVDNPLEAARNLERSLGLPNKGPIHGFVDGNYPSVIPLDQNIRMEKVGEINLVMQWPIEKYGQSFSRALGRANIALTYEDARLRTVLELFSGVQRETSLRSQLLTCMTALRILAQPVKKHEVVQRLLDRLNEEITAQMQAYPAVSEEHHALESLQREVAFRREASLRSSIRKLMLTGLVDLPEPTRTDRSREMVWAYDVRGALVHDGSVAPADLKRAHDIAYQGLLDLLARRIALIGS